ncbi:hypothetical protein [Luteimonas sp. MHLX1A]|uniref:hypothetical protein n=1 Tax=Alterluteimonas muca TaxID=2878684 RepID=UPI001E55A3D9|nr:hypothetical protein [Luteimonas sp. MHLX1A]MCD9047087.1 hypothetical protein [Luteimonas sp. MHLX1A]MCD9047092.1 hypothetical protein [Luteimonas sp. MHLX1A]
MDFSQVPTGMIVLASVAVIAALIMHWRMRKFWLASVASAASTVAVFLVLSVIQQRGLPDPLEPLAFFYFALFGLVVAIIVGGFVRAVRLVLPVRA